MGSSKSMLFCPYLLYANGNGVLLTLKIKENTNYLNLYLYSYMTVDNHHHYVYNRHHRNYIIENFNQSCSQTM